MPAHPLSRDMLIWIAELHAKARALGYAGCGQNGYWGPEGALYYLAQQTGKSRGTLHRWLETAIIGGFITPSSDPAPLVAARRAHLFKTPLAPLVAATRRSDPLPSPPTPPLEKPRVRVPAGRVAHTPPPPPPPEPTLDERAEISGLRNTVQSWRRRAEQAEAEVSNLRSWYRTAAGLREAPLEPAVIASVDHSGRQGGIPCFLWSDWHIGETIDPAQVHNVNVYNRAVTEARIAKLVEKSIYMATTYLARPRTDTAVLFLLGDFVSGWQHEELIATDWCTPIQATQFAVRWLGAAIRRLLDVVDQLQVVCCVGNHGRLFHKRPPAKIETWQSFDWLIYGQLSAMFEGDSRIGFAVPDAGDYLIDVAGTRYLATHGHKLGVKGGDALIGNIGPLVRGRLKLSRSSESLGRGFDVLVMGHWHSTVWLPLQQIIVNNCLVGYNEYAMSQRYIAAPPSQLLWWTDPKYGPTSPVEIFVEDQPARHLRASALEGSEQNEL